MDNNVKLPPLFGSSQMGGHDDEPQFTFDIRDDLTDVEAPVGSSGGLVVLLLNPGERTGIAFSPEAARKMGVILISCAERAEMEQEEEREWRDASAPPGSSGQAS